MLYRIKDFESVYNISENKFRQKDEDFLIKRCIDDVIDIAKNDIKKKNIDLQINHSGELPNFIKGDATKFKQVLLNIIL
jgi:signal transduction histidine kinase